MKLIIVRLFVFTSLLCLMSLPAHSGMDTSKSSFSSKEMELRTNMRYLFTQYLAWQRVAAAETIAGAQDAAKAQARFVSSQDDICGIFKSYFGDYNGGQITNIFKQYNQFISDYVEATRSHGDKALIINRMHDKAEEMGSLLNMANMNWSKDEIAAAFKKYADMLVSEIDLQGNNPGSVDTAMMDATFAQSMDMADTFTSGIIKQDPAKFW
jgi:hypothetical protein